MRRLLLILFFLPLLSYAQVKYNPEAKKAYAKGVKEYKNNNLVDALKYFKQAVAIEPIYAEAHLNISNIHYGRSKFNEALASAKSAYANNKFEASIYTQLGKCYYKTGNADSAAFFLEKGVSLGSSGEFDLLYLGKSQASIENYDAALINLDKVIAINDKNIEAYNAKGSVYFNMFEFEKADAQFKKALEIDPSSGAVLSNLANSALLQGKSDEALEYVQKGLAAANDQQKVELLVIAGSLHFSNKELDEAADMFKQAYDLDQNNIVVLNNQAALFLEQSQYESAIEKCNAALDIQPEMMEAYFNRGIANEMLRNVADACSDWEQAFILGSEEAEEFLNSATCNE
ncbi:MAG: tetratricopeptide repeat protein [Crocinitomicaceae bacterium]